MYFFSEEERKYLLKKLIPSTRERGIAEDLRGWNWHCSELSPPHDILMPVWEVSDRDCETGRDTYLRHVQKVSVPASEEMVAGRIYHQLWRALSANDILQRRMSICAERQVSDERLIRHR